MLNKVTKGDNLALHWCICELKYFLAAFLYQYEEEFFVSFIFIFRLNVLPACAPGACESQKRVKSLEAGVTQKVVNHHVCWEPNLGALQEQPVRALNP